MTIKIADKFKNDAIATLVQICRTEDAPAAPRVSAAQQLLAYSLGRPSASKPVTVATLKDLTPNERHELFRALVQYYAEDIGLDTMLSQVVDEVERRVAAQPKLTFTRGNAAPTPPPASTGADSAHARPRSRGEGSRSMRGSEQGFNARAASGRPSPCDPGLPGPHLQIAFEKQRSQFANVGQPQASDMDASTSRSERLAELAVQFLPSRKSAPPLAADSGDGYAHALRLSRLSASELEQRYFGRFTGTDTDPSIWRVKK